MMQRTPRSFLSFALLVVVALLASCSATGKFKNLGEPPVWKDTTELPVPDDGTVEPNTIRMNFQCPTMEDDEAFLDTLRESVVAQCRQAGMGDVKLLPRKSGKKAHYEIMVYEAGEDGKFDFNEEAGIWAGVGTGVATGILTESLGTGIAGGVAGGAAAGLLLGEKKEVYAFAGVCRQRTSLAASKTADAGNKNATNTGGGVKDRDTGNSTQNQGNRSILESAQWNLKTQAYEFPFMFQIAVEGGSMSNKKARDAAAREVFMKRFPKFATGGSTL